MRGIGTESGLKIRDIPPFTGLDDFVWTDSRAFSPGYHRTGLSARNQ